MTKKILLGLVLIVVSISLTFCGKKEEKSEAKEEVKTESKTEVANASDLGAKIKAYEDFVTKFCALSEKMKNASPTEKATLAKDFTNDNDNVTKLQAELDAAKSSPEEKERIAVASKKAAGCAAVAAGASTPTNAPAVPKIPTKAPSIPGM